MDLYKIFFVIVLLCVLDQGSAWLRGGGGSKSKHTSRKGSGSGKQKSGWWSGGSRNKPSKPTAKPQPKPPALKPDPKPEEKQKSGWWFVKPKPEPPKNTESKPEKSGWWSSNERKVTPKPTSKPNIPVTNKGTDSKPDSKPKEETETDMKKVIEGFEGMRLKAYDAQPKNPNVHDITIGIGFNMNRLDARETFEKIVPEKDFDKVKSGKESITKAEARALFDHDVDTIYEPAARNRVDPEVYDKLPSNVKTALVNAVYRGDLRDTTTKLIKEGKWEEAGEDYLDYDQYKHADELGIPGVKIRMDWNKEQFDTMIKPDKETP